MVFDGNIGMLSIKERETIAWWDMKEHYRRATSADASTKELYESRPYYQICFSLIVYFRLPLFELLVFG